MKFDKEVLPDGKVKLTYNGVTRKFVNEYYAEQFILKIEGENAVNRQPHIHKTLSLDEIDGGVWVDAFHKTINQ